MDRGFNDDELADIMSEIESLEQEFTEEVEAKAEPVEESPEVVEEQTENVETVIAEHNEPIEAQPEPVMEQKIEEPVQEAQPQEVVTAKEEEFVGDDEVEDAFAEVEQEQQPVQEAAPVLEQVAQKPVEEVVQPVESHDDWRPKIMEKNENVSGAQTSMNFKIEGDMKLDLVFHVSGHEVQLAVNENGLEIGLEGGAKFSVPLSASLKQDKAA